MNQFLLSSLKIKPSYMLILRDIKTNIDPVQVGATGLRKARDGAAVVQCGSKENTKNVQEEIYKSLEKKNMRSVYLKL